MSAAATRVYADYAAGAPLRPEAARALGDALASVLGNASSVHFGGARARALLEAAREEVAAAVGAHPLEIVFTSGATEANNLALAGVAAATGAGGSGARGLRIAVPATEHSSVLRVAEALATRGHTLLVLPVGSDGRTDPAAVEAAVPDLLSVALVNAETGVVQDVGALAAAARRSGAYVHVDAAQAAVVLPLDAVALDCDLLTVSGHKVGGGTGSGALYVRNGTPLAPLHHGGTQERGLRAGTENVAALAAFATAFAAARGALPTEVPRLAALTTRLRDGIRARAPGARFAAVRNDGSTGARHFAVVAPHILDVGFPSLAADSLVAALDLEGIAVSAGSACAAGASEPSHVLRAMGWSAADAASAVRFSVGWASTAADVERILEVLPRILERARVRVRETAWPAHVS